jgi:SAM-dependent methyltransferase
MLTLASYAKIYGGTRFSKPHFPACEICTGIKSTALRDSCSVGADTRVEIGVSACDYCGFISQSPRLDSGFYQNYYKEYYRKLLTGTNSPSDGFLNDQIERGEYLYASLSPVLPEKGRLLDVGCSSGGLMLAFRRRGWRVFGTDPDLGYAEFGAKKFDLPIVVQSAEKMQLESKAFDLVIIAGSLEHVCDPNKVLSICRKASAEGALLFLEGRGLAQARQTKTCGHNHRRMLTGISIELLMFKHGWTPCWTTDKELSGPTRPQSIFGLGVTSRRLTSVTLSRLIESGKRDPISTTVSNFAEWGIV